MALSGVSFGASVAAGAASAFAKAAVTMGRVAQVVARLERFFLSTARIMRNVAEFFTIWKEVIMALRALKKSAGMFTLPGLGWGAAGAVTRAGRGLDAVAHPVGRAAGRQVLALAG